MKDDQVDEQAFGEAFKALTEHAPLPWQRRLFGAHFLPFGMGGAALPPALDLPTGLGKTSVMAIWLIALAMQAARGAVRLPRRLVYVVDRRTVVDQATDVAEGMRARLRGVSLPAGDDAALSGIRAALSGLCVDPADDASPLAISTLRGEHADNLEWQADPARAAIIVGTVDMIGSRLLFEGYGASRRMRPFHAGLLGSDALLILDESHLCPPFESLLRALTNGSCAPRAPAPGRLLMSLSATGRMADGDAFRLTLEDAEDEFVTRRLKAKKRLALHGLTDKIDADLSELAWRQATEAAPSRVVVFCDSRKVAQKVADEIRKRAEKKKVEIEDPRLLTGARRVYERERLAEDLQALGFTGEDRRAADKPTFLVATSAGEVGIDLDADHMVGDLVAYERMAQRLGRVNRRGGEDRCAMVDVVVHATPRRKLDGKNETDAEARTRVDRQRAVLAALPKGDDERHDASPGAFLALKAASKDLAQAATSPAPLHPALTPALVDAWSMTSLAEHMGRPEIDPWLRGWVDDDERQTRMIWRARLPWRAGARQPDKREVEDFFDAAPPHLRETLEVEVWLAVNTLLARAKEALTARQSDGADAGVSPEAPALIVLDRRKTLVSAWTIGRLAAAGDDKAAKEKLERDLANNVAVLWAGLGGLDRNGLPEAGASDVPRCLDGATAETRFPDDVLKDIGLRVMAIGEADDLPQGWRETFRLVLGDPDADKPEGLIVAEPMTAPGDRPEIAGLAQTLAAHKAAIVAEARRLGERLGLPAPFIEMLAHAARLHDDGKACARWQIYAGNRGFRVGRDENNPLAKFVGRADRRLLETEIGGRRLTYRHEFGSLAHAEADSALAKLPGDLRDLALHLIAAHHGRARPTIAPVSDDAPPSACLARAREVALRFARLQRAWGPWGLAWWETLLRAADHAASRKVDSPSAAAAPRDAPDDADAQAIKAGPRSAAADAHTPQERA